MKVVHFDVDQELSRYLEGEKYPHSLQEEQNKKILDEAEAISFKLKSKATSDSLSRFTKLKLIITRTVGLDHIDLDYCRAQGISVYHIPDYGAFNIAEHAFALLLSGTRNIVSSQKDIQNGLFRYAPHLGVALKGKILGVVGTGKIGLEMIKRAVGFEMEVIAYDVYKNEKAAEELGFRYVDLEELLSKSDVISLHAPLIPTTEHMINEESIMKMKDGVVLINTGRGGLIDTAALVKLINKFRFVGLDVIEDEDSFNRKHPLLSHENVLITPHIAFYSDASVKIIAEKTIEKIAHFKKGLTEGKVV